MNANAFLRAISIRTRAEILLGAVLVFALAWQTHKRHAAERRGAELALIADTLVATRDTTRRLALNATVLGDSIHAVQRQAVQVTQRADSLDRALKLERITRTQIVARVETLTVHTTGAVTVANTTDTATRSATFTGRQVPYNYSVSTVVPAPPGAATLDLHVTLDAIPLELRLGCGKANGDGIKSAEATLTGPTWATLQLGRVEQSPDLCRSPALEPAHGDGRSWIRRVVDRVGISAGYGATASKGSVQVGPTVSAGVKLWP